MRENCYRNYLLTVLILILASNTSDRVALGLLLQDIKVDLALSDTQLGLVTGIAFSFFYAVMGIPIARWADRGNRIAIVAITTALWSVGVALCGAVGNFLHLLLIRVGVAVGEAGCVPTAHSLIADYFGRAERAQAIARYMFGIPISYVIGYFLAGKLNELYGWRTTFVLIGLPGIVLAALAWVTLQEPRRARSASSPPELEIRSASMSPHITDVFRTLLANRTFRNSLIGYSVAAFFGYGVWQWKPAFFIRTYGLETSQVGIWFAIIHGLGGLLGMYVGGELALRYASQNERLQLRSISIAYCGFGVLSALMFLSPNHYVAFVLMSFATVGLYTVYGPLFATIQTLVQPDLRAMAIAAVYFAANLVGMGLGPLAAGWLSDTFQPWVGNESLRYALLVLCPGYVLTAWYLWQASRTVTQDLLLAQVSDRPACAQQSSPEPSEGGFSMHVVGDRRDAASKEHVSRQ